MHIDVLTPASDTLFDTTDKKYNSDHRDIRPSRAHLLLSSDKHKLHPHAHALLDPPAGGASQVRLQLQSIVCVQSDAVALTLRKPICTLSTILHGTLNAVLDRLVTALHLTALRNHHRYTRPLLSIQVHMLNFSNYSQPVL